MDSTNRNELFILGMRWRSLAETISDGVRLSLIKKDVASVVKDTKKFIKKVRYVYDC